MKDEKCVIDITDYNVSNDDLIFLNSISQKERITITDTNWFGGVWSLKDFLEAEQKLNNVIEKIKSKNLSNFEEFICAYHYASARPYKFAPKGSAFQTCRSYVDVMNNGFCVCVGYATILKRLCDKLGIECAVQGCLAKDKFGKVINHANNLVRLKDEKYNIDGIYYCDPRMDCLVFLNSENTWLLNSLAMPITDIGKIIIKAWNDDTIIEMNDFQSLYYSRTLSISERDYLAKFFSQNTLNKIMIYKYCKPITENTIFKALANIGINKNMAAQIQKDYYIRKPMFISDVTTNKFKNEWEKRLSFVDYLRAFYTRNKRQDQTSKLDCATFVSYVFRNYFGVDIMKNGFGNSWTGKILTSDCCEFKSIDEQMSLKQKINFIDTKCKSGDILFFHRQSKNENQTTEDNWYPGHCGIYLGNHKYIDSRLTSRGNIAIVDIDNDHYMDNFIGFKDMISTIKESESNEVEIPKEF